MKAAIIFVMMVFAYGNMQAQILMDGKGRKLSYKTIDEADSILAPNGVHVFFSKDYKKMIGFKKLSDKPVWVMADNAAQIPGLIKSFDYKKYLNSAEFRADMLDMIAENKLNTAYLLNIFGRPDSVTLDPNEIWDVWIYKKYNFQTTIDDSSKAFDAKFIHYRTIKNYSLMITRYEVTADDYSGGFSIEVYNYSNKTIKYMWITTIAYNPVHDIIGTKTVQGVGPVGPMQSGSSDFESVYYSKVLHSISLSQIKIQYMDGSVKVIPSPVVGELIIYENK